MKNRCVVVICVAAGMMLCSPLGKARFLPSWPYEKLMKEADLVVIAKPTKSEASADEPPKHQWQYEFVGQNTTFDVKYTLKGKLDEKQIKVLHFKWGKLKTGFDPKDPFSHIIDDGPLLVAFDIKDAPEYLLFLKKMNDGRYEPVSGKIDPRLSARLLSDPREEVKKP
jgi:hypothetical protein